VYWLNGQRNVLPRSRATEATAIAVSGSNVYIAGRDGYIDAADGNAVYWLNGRRNVLPQTGEVARATAIAVTR